jgi:signal transduction histidine kinase
MRKLLNIIALLLLPFLGIAQDAAVNITPAMFNQNGQYYISLSDSWRFKQGNDTAWARKDFEPVGWQKLSPTDISEKYADKNGRVEGWFRVNIKIESPSDGAFGIKCASWAATDVYVDGKLITSNGNTGANGKPYVAGTIMGHLAMPAYLKPGVAHTIAMHFVDYRTAIPPFGLKSQYAQMVTIISITKPEYNFNYAQNLVKNKSFETMWVSVGMILSLLFWLLSIQNPSEKNLRLIAIGSTFSTASTLFSALGDAIGKSFSDVQVCDWFSNFFVGGSSILTLIILVSIFKRKFTPALIIFLVIFLAFTLVERFLPADIDDLGTKSLIVIQTVLSIYYIVSAWKNLKGSQWAIVVGLTVSLFTGGLYTYASNYYNFSINTSQLFTTISSLSFPLSLLVYVSMRFKEIINEVQENAAQVVQLSEEKKQEALNRQKVLQEEVNRQTNEIRNSLETLKATQTQLIQKEKMASLGELTAGIAHEIQNPLNFVNNFSEVSIELLDELKEEAQAGHTDDVIAIATDLSQNLEKINHHGKRADSIVKGMLEHSRVGSGEKHLVDLNALADEFLKLSYHGLRAKDKNFNAELITNFDENLPKVTIAQQDIGRVLLNLFNNAFYAVNQKQKTAGPDYKPEVTVSTSTEKNNLVIKVKDNGNGIPDAIKEKIMQPFFTTKPTGEGTGLGLSLSYDIVVKGHGGSITVETREGIFTEFKVQLPLI